MNSNKNISNFSSACFSHMTVWGGAQGNLINKINAYNIFKLENYKHTSLTGGII